MSHGRNRAARAIARLMRLPAEHDTVKTRLIVHHYDGGEQWLRDFGGRLMNSCQYPVTDGQIGERFGVVECRFVREQSGGTTRYRQTGVAIVVGAWRLALPLACGPRVTAREDAISASRRHVAVQIALPLVGPLLSYEGTIDIDEAAT